MRKLCLKTEKDYRAKVGVITGAASGIGEATAKRFLAEGASEMLIGRSAEKLEKTC